MSTETIDPGEYRFFCGSSHPLLAADIAKLSDEELQTEVRRRVGECLETLRRHPQFAHKRPQFADESGAAG